ncbi:MAG: DNA replication and repair protein RecF [Bacteroidales bacterium]|nr:DNA replication and repair protein RecF [Bacteroidales bacterium]MBD5387368.1 DNA replication and repair protein RecF [bacterium]
MQLNKIDILNFKNIQEARLDFSPGVNCFLGMNGMGKSNLLEAVYFLSMSRPLHSLPEAALIRHGEEMLMVKGDYLTDAGGDENVSCGIVKGKGKTLKRNGKEYTRISEHIGKFPIVSVLPSDSEIVSGSGENRRRLMDMVISQADPLYLAWLIKYNRSLESRNKMLRAGVRDTLLYESIESGLCAAAAEIHASRKRWTEEIRPVFERYYSMISGDAERASIKYKSVLNETDMQHALNSARQKDVVLGFTSQGVHRDDLQTGLGDYSMRRLGSQGQVKSFTIALKFAIFDYLRQGGNQTPILLLDDIFDKLDSSRVGRIMEAVSGEGGFGQIFITDTNREHLDETISSIRSESRLFEVKDGEFKIVDS